ncbi:TetR/AcrR family transcriptional regulator [Paenibacillus tianjinensis]|uniref:TetR/AcrR family transcriptional regulator n=1 Tax=Paenibacillus tianjinensis TaxID=2810347 RepID=UPI001E5AF77D|nr:TetR/AcrR family transcriptional regulator [Paenibacillus tianjinensis]
MLGSAERRSREMELRRKDIIEAAEHVFFEKGYERSTMDDVAKQAEFSKRTLYAYFNSKEQIYFEIMIRGYRRLIGLLQDKLQGNNSFSAMEALWEITSVYYEFSCGEPHYFQAIIEYENSLVDFQNGIPDESRDECYALGEEALQFVKTALQKGVEDGSIRADLPVDQATMTLWASMLGIFSTVRTKKHYLERYYKIGPGEFIQESFHLLLRFLEPAQ